ncbi:Protein FAR1-RELATED SEQUENCE [Arachis hypogaea]|nr:Protein FAR1-RELATED SEQUENCE [Arachis hypogaea]
MTTGRPHRSSFVLFVYVLKVTVAFNFWIPDNGGGWNRSKRSSRRRHCLSHPPDRRSWHHRSRLVLITRGVMHVVFLEVCVCSRQVEAVRMLEACWIVDEVVTMASSSKFCKDACMWNEPLADNWMEGKTGVSNPQDTMYDTRVEEDAELSDWEGRGASMLPLFLGLDGLQAEDVLEMEFSSPQEASGFYNNYSRLKGFASRRGKTVRNTAGEIVRYTFVCNRQGFREKKWLEKVDRKREHKVVTRCGCMAEMRIKRKEGSGRWYVSRFVEEHNHELAYGKLVDYLRSHRKISEVEVAQLTSMREIGISIPKIYESFAAQLGGFNLFEAHWESMVNECGVREVEWVKELYAKKHAWATAYIRGRFFAGVRTTSRCESLHAKLGRFVESRYGVLEFVRNFQRCVNFLRDTEDELDFRSWYGTPVLQTEFVELEKSGWSMFTREMFLRFRDSLKRCVRVRICEFNDSENPHAYTLQKYRRPEMNWKVYRDHISNTFSCTCMRMESFGFPCVHILSVCVSLDLVEIPESLVLRRWSKAAKLEIHNQCVEQHTADPSVTYRTRLGAFSQLYKRLGRVACMSDEDFKFYSKKLLSDALFLEIKYGLRPSTDDITTANDCGVKDPIRVRTKGTGRMSQAGGSASKTKRKCSTCGKLGHRRTRYPNGAAQAPTRNNESHGGRNKRKRSKVPVVVPDNCQAENACQAGSDKWEHFSLADP